MRIKKIRITFFDDIILLVRDRILLPNGNVHREELRNLISCRYKVNREFCSKTIGDMLKYGYLDLSQNTSSRFCFYRIV